MIMDFFPLNACVIFAVVAVVVAAVLVVVV